MSPLCGSSSDSLRYQLETGGSGFDSPVLSRWEQLRKAFLLYDRKQLRRNDDKLNYDENKLRRNS